MSDHWKDKTIRRTAEEIPAASAEELARVLAIPDEEIDTSDIPERTGERHRLRRDQHGRLPARRSPIREAVQAAMAERELTAYALWKAARVHCPTISETAVGEFVQGRRSIGLPYLDAILSALNLTIEPVAALVDRGDSVSSTSEASDTSSGQNSLTF